MPEARDRLSRAEDVAAVYARRRRSIISGENERGETMTNQDEDRMEGGSATPFRWGETPLTGRRGGMGLAGASAGGGGGLEWGGLRSPIIWRGNTLQISPGTVIGRRNISPAIRGSRGRGRGHRGGVLPNWYPRVPLQDITEIVRAIERRRARMREGEGLQLESSIPQEQAVFDPSVSTSGAQLEHSTSTFTPYPTRSGRPRPISVPKILFDITNQKDGESDDLTPQKKLLNSIDTVEQVVTEELRKMKRTPAAKRAERDKKVKTLMSMR